MTALSGVHAVNRILHENVLYPEHAARTESPAYANAHHHMVVELDLPCIVCGVKNSTLGDATQNRFGAKAIETHHHVLEWALQNAVDPAKFNARLLPNLAHRYPNEPLYKQPMNGQQILDWVDHSEHNLWPVCDVHHRHVEVGIHAITYPAWVAQDLLLDEYVQGLTDTPPLRG